MRRLTKTLVTGKNNERGVIAPLTALLMVAMLGMTAFAVDTAMMYSEHAQLQNGADATALAIAQSCSGGLHLVTCQKDLANANALAGSNALDGATEVVHSKVVTKDNLGTVDVEVQALDTAGKKLFAPVFAPIFGITQVDIRATAQAKFEGYRSAHVLPLTFSQCGYDPTNTTKLQFFQVTTPASQPACQSKAASKVFIPGGFGWLVHTVFGGNCSLEVNAGSTYENSDTGNDVPADCKTKFAEFQKVLEGGNTVDVLVPIFDEVISKGAGGMYHVEAFAQISLRGWQFSSVHYFTPEAAAMPKPTNNGLFGRFVKKVTVSEAAVLGGPGTYMPVIRLSN